VARAEAGNGANTPIFLKVERRGRVKYLPKEARLLSGGNTP